LGVVSSCRRGISPADKEETRMAHVHLLLAFRWGRIRIKIRIRF